MLTPAIFLLMLHAFDPSKALLEYVARKQPGFAWVRSSAGPPESFKLTSQSWQGTLWRHDLIVQSPRSVRDAGKVAYLVITGDRVDSVDLPFGQALADASGLPVATLFNVPNQPLFDKREDDLIAYSFGKYLETSDPSWPALFPMVASAVRAMDALQEATKGPHQIQKFIVTGESKRGWTSWLVGCLNDPRVVGIAPVAFDNLNFAGQLHHQMVSWGHLSEMLGSYTEGGLDQAAESAGGKEIIQMVDPFSYLSTFRAPILSIRGSNDRYWAADAMQLYWDHVSSPKGCLVLPNEGHDFQNDGQYIAALAQFSHDVRHPRGWKTEAVVSGDAVSCSWTCDVKLLRLWEVSAPTLDLRDGTWRVAREIPVTKGRFAKVPAEPPTRGCRAFFIEFVRTCGSSLTSEIWVKAAKP